jgi:RND family efflux transporter MFP subunit
VTLLWGRLTEPQSSGGRQPSVCDERRFKQPCRPSGSLPRVLLAWSLFGIVVIAGCERASNSYQAPPPPKVFVTHPEVRDVPEYLEFTGTTAAVQSVEVRARVKGYLEQVHFKDGADIEAGTLLATIEPAPFQAVLDQQLASLRKAKADAALAVAELERATPLFEKKVITKGELEVKQAEKEVTEAMVGVAEAAVRQAELDLGYTQIKAPLAGRIGRREIDPGSLVQAEQTLLTSIYQMDPVHVYFNVSEREVLQIRGKRYQETGSPERNKTIVVSVGTQDEQGYPSVGTFDYSDPAADTGTGTFRVRALIPNPNKLLLPGLYVRVRTHMGIREKAVLIDETAIGSEPRGRFVYVVNDKGIVERRSVVLGQLLDRQRVVLEGLSASDRVVTEGIQRIRAGAQVTAEMRPQATTAAASATSTGTAAEPAASDVKAGGATAVDSKATDSSAATTSTTTDPATGSAPAADPATQEPQP